MNADDLPALGGDRGRIEVEREIGPPLLPLAGQAATVGTTTGYVWIPPASLSDQLPRGFRLAVRCIHCPDGRRRFYPALSFEEFIGIGFTAGLAVLGRLAPMTAPQRHSYRAMYLLFQRLRQTREHFGNSLLSATTLRISRVAQDSLQERSILPESVGLNDKGQGEPWGVERLLREGRHAAREASVSRPSEEDCIHYGLVAAARLNPLRVPDEQTSGLVRAALYETIALEAPLDPALLDQVVERTLGALDAHLWDSAGEFTAWFSGPKNSLVRQIGKRKLRPGGVLGQNVVRRALQELGWRAYQYVADCVHAAMYLFERLMPELLTEPEQNWFRHVYLKQPYLAGLPLVLLVERFRFLRSVLWEIGESPGDRRPIEVLHRLLAYYAEMAASRRAADRRTKQRRPAGLLPGEQTPLTVSYEGVAAAAASDRDREGEPVDGDDAMDEEEGIPGEASSSPDSGTPGLFGALADLARDRRQVRCQCADPEWDDRVVASQDAEVVLEHSCARCHFSARSTWTMAEIARLAREQLGPT